MTTPTHTLDAGYAGWFRACRAARWTRIAAGDDYGEASLRTADALAAVRGGESIVVRMNVNPNGPTRRRRIAR